MALKLSYYRYTAIEDSFKKIVVTVVTIATSKIAVTLDNHSKSGTICCREMRKMGKLLHNEARELLVESYEKTHNAE